MYISNDEFAAEIVSFSNDRLLELEKLESFSLKPYRSHNSYAINYYVEVTRHYIILLNSLCGNYINEADKIATCVNLSESFGTANYIEFDTDNKITLLYIITNLCKLIKESCNYIKEINLNLTLAYSDEVFDNLTLFNHWDAHYSQTQLNAVNIWDDVLNKTNTRILKDIAARKALSAGKLLPQQAEDIFNPEDILKLGFFIPNRKPKEPPKAHFAQHSAVTKETKLTPNQLDYRRSLSNLYTQSKEKDKLEKIKSK